MLIQQRISWTISFKNQSKGKITFLAGDFNFNLIKYRQNKGTAKFLKHLFSNNFIPQITLLTRFTSSSKTRIDIFIDNQEFLTISGNFTTSISECLPQFTIIESFKELYETNKDKFSYRNIKKFNQKFFNKELKCIGLSLATKNDDLDLCFRTFFHLSIKTLDKHAPMKQGIRKANMKVEHYY